MPNEYYYINHDHEVSGPIGEEELTYRHASGSIEDDTYVVPAGSEDWHTYADTFNKPLPAKLISSDEEEKLIPTSPENQKFYTLSTSGPLSVRTAHVKKTVGGAFILDKPIQAPDGTRKKLLLNTHKVSLPSSPTQAIQVYIEEQQEKVHLMRENLQKELLKLEEAHALLAERKHSDNDSASQI